MACPNIGTIEINIKMALNAVMERDSQNPTPILDKEPLNKRTLHIRSLLFSFSIIQGSFIHL